MRRGLRPLKAAVSAQKAFQGWETKTNYIKLLGGMVRYGSSPTRSHWFAFQLNVLPTWPPYVICLPVATSSSKIVLLTRPGCHQPPVRGSSLPQRITQRLPWPQNHLQDLWQQEGCPGQGHKKQSFLLIELLCEKRTALKDIIMTLMAVGSL